LPDARLHLGLRKGLTANIKMENTIVGIIALGLIVYLIFTIIRPEKF
jgi:K+-transporting ATPase KdpF subunit